MTPLNRSMEDNFSQVVSANSLGLESVALDGKTLRGSHHQRAHDAHLLSTMSPIPVWTLGQVAITDQTNEIGACPDWLADLVLEGRVFTMDALLTQRPIARTMGGSASGPCNDRQGQSTRLTCRYCHGL
jgi:hypothetical protein